MTQNLWAVMLAAVALAFAGGMFMGQGNERRALRQERAAHQSVVDSLAVSSGDQLTAIIAARDSIRELRGLVRSPRVIIRNVLDETQRTIHSLPLDSLAIVWANEVHGR